MKYLAFIIFLVLSLPTMSLYSQMSVQDLPKERIKLFTDKDYYSAGDTLYYSAYLLDQASLLPSDISNVVYIELINQQDSIVARNSLYMEKSSAGGKIGILKSWGTGDFFLRSYTNYMLNNKENKFAYLPIKVLDLNQPYSDAPLESTSIQKDESKHSTQLKFYPESGKLIEGVKNSLAFEVVGNLSSIHNEAYIEDDLGNKIAFAKIYDYGLGRIYFTPKIDRKYSFILSDGGKELAFTLPVIFQEGVSFYVQPRPNHFLVNIGSDLKADYQFEAWQNGKKVFSENIQLNPSVELIKLSKEVLPEGAITLKLNKEGSTIKERKIFNEHSEKASIGISNLKANYTKEDNINLRLKLLTKDAIEGSFNVNISHAAYQEKRYDDFSFYQDTFSKKYPRLQLHNESQLDRTTLFLKDLVESIKSYHINRVLPLKERDSLEFNAELGRYLRGTVAKAKDPKKTTESIVMASIIDSYNVEQKYETAEDGKFIFGPFALQDTAYALLIAQTKNDLKDESFTGGSDLAIFMDEDGSIPSVSRPDFTKLLRNKDLNQELVLTAKAIREQRIIDGEYIVDEFDEVKISASKLRPIFKTPEDLVSSRFYRNYSNRIQVAGTNYGNAFGIQNILRTVPGIRVRSVGNQININIRGNRNNPIILLDGMPADNEVLTMFSPDEIWFIDILRGTRAMALGLNAANDMRGAIAIYTKAYEGYTPDLEEDSGATKVKIIPFDNDYEYHGFNDEKQSKDLRSTLYWHPSILLDEKNSANIAFTTSSLPGEYIIQVSGFTSDGRYLRYKKTFQVE